MALTMKKSSDTTEAECRANDSSSHSDDGGIFEDKSSGLISCFSGHRSDSNEDCSFSHIRRASSQDSAMHCRRWQTHAKTRHALRDVIRNAERRSIPKPQEQPLTPPSLHQSKRFERMDSLRNVLVDVQGYFRDGYASKIQAVYRGFRVRKHRMISLSVGQNLRITTPLFHHHRVTSEITMSDFEESLMGDSFVSTDSPAWSPRTNFRRFEDSCFHNSTATAITSAITDPSEGEAQYGSFSTLFSHDAAQDLPVRMPFRKETPPKPNVMSRFVGAYFNKTTPAGTLTPDKDKQCDTIVSRFPDVARLDLADIQDEDMGSSIGALPYLKQRKSSRNAHGGHQPLFLALDDDEPMKPPSRVLSPGPPIPISKPFLSLTKPSNVCGCDNASDVESIGEGK